MEFPYLDTPRFIPLEDNKFVAVVECIESDSRHNTKLIVFQNEGLKITTIVLTQSGYDALKELINNPDAGIHSQNVMHEFNLKAQWHKIRIDIRSMYTKFATK